MSTLGVPKSRCFVGKVLQTHFFTEVVFCECQSRFLPFFGSLVEPCSGFLCLGNRPENLWIFGDVTDPEPGGRGW